MPRVFAPAPFRWPAQTGTDYPYGSQDIADDTLVRTLVTAGLVQRADVAPDPAIAPGSFGASITAAQVAERATAPLAARADGLTVLPDGNIFSGPQLRIRGLSLWFPFLAGLNQDPLKDRATGLLLTKSGTGTLGGAPALAFNGSTFLYSSPAVMTAIQRSILNISTLSAAEALYVYFILTHPTTLTQACIFYWGAGSTNGWGIETTGAPGKLQWDHNPAGGTRDQFALDTSLALRGDTATNTKTAVALQITRVAGDTGGAGRGQGLFHIEMHKAGLSEQGPFGQMNFTQATPQRVPNTGTAPASYTATAGLTIGQRASTSQTTGTDLMPNGYGLDNLGFVRAARTEGITSLLARQLRDLYVIGRHQDTQPPCVAL